MKSARIVVLSWWLAVCGLLAGPLCGPGTAAPATIAVSSETVSRALDAYQHRRYRRALRLLQPYANDPDPSGAVHFILGKIYYAANDFQRAHHFSRRAAGKLRNAGAREQLIRLRNRSGQLARLSFQRRTYRHFHVLVPSRLSPGLADRLNHGLMKAYRGVGGDLGYFPKVPVTLIVYPPEPFRRVVGGPTWSSGIFDSKIHLLYRPDRTPPYHPATLYHEYTHALIFALARDHVPVWFNEGLATFEELRHDPGRRGTLSWESLKPRHPLPSFDEIDRMFRSKTDRRRARRAYRYSLSLIHYLRQRHGLGQVERILDAAGKSGSFPRAFRRITGRTLSSFHRRWGRWLEEQTG